MGRSSSRFMTTRPTNGSALMTASVFAENALKCQTTNFNPTGNKTPVIDMSDVEDPLDTEQDGTGNEKGDKKVGSKYMSLCDSAATLSWESQVMRGERSHPVRWEFCSNLLRSDSKGIRT